MPKSSDTKGRRQMPRSSAARRAEEQEEESARLAEYRAKSACLVHRASGDPEEVCKDGLAVFNALATARKRANETALKKDE
jgi:hypothetical protein